MPVASVNDGQAVRIALAQCPLQDPEGLLEANPGLADSLRETVTEFLIERYTAATADDYIHWMQSQGYRFKSLEQFEQKYGPIAIRASAAGVQSTDPEEVFRAMWSHPPSRRAVPDGICADEKAPLIVVAKSNTNRRFTATLEGALGYELWHGGQIANCRVWMEAPVTREQIVLARGEAIAAQVGVVATVPGAGRRPIHIALYLDPQHKRWWIDSVTVGNHADPNGGWDCCEY